MNDGNAAKDIPALWSQFLQSEVQAKLSEKISPEIYCVYQDYESDHLGPYTVFLGCPLPENAEVPEGFKVTEIAEGAYRKFLSKGDLHKGSVFNTWQEIWSTEMERTYNTDYEVYGERSKDPHNAEVDIYIGINS